MKRELRLYSTTRAIRSFLEASKQEDILLPSTLTILEFQKKAVYFEERNFIDKVVRDFVLYNSKNFQEFKELNFPAQIIQFLKSSNLLGSFIDELSLENISVQSLYEYDFYEDYKTHIKALEIFMGVYEKQLDINLLVDKINQNKHQKLNKNFLENFDEITLNLDGAINEYDLCLYEEISAIVPFYINYIPTIYNKKTTNRLEKKLSKKLILNRTNKIDLTSKNVDITSPKMILSKDIKCCFKLNFFLIYKKSF